jgi:transposase-like protein
MANGPGPKSLAAAYERCGSVSGVAKEYGVAYDTARKWLIAANVQLRPRGRQSPSASTAPLAQIIERYRKGESFVAIASTLNVSPNTVRNRLLEAGEPLRPRPGWKY